MRRPLWLVGRIRRLYGLLQSQNYVLFPRRGGQLLKTSFIVIPCNQIAIWTHVMRLILPNYNVAGVQALLRARTIELVSPLLQENFKYWGRIFQWVSVGVQELSSGL